ncbi:hypothetical protein BpHYR1_032546 [Brachionus plicatilis]|uniref:Uncharacterized protein n=1 Tax=Brachionus plicatilis TaxID=10195 RepID=A0A3M7SKT7_BRAPC|nr:hypothetical protein BpHYR1_032546 [Brachionus plicatilis]
MVIIIRMACLGVMQSKLHRTKRDQCGQLDLEAESIEHNNNNKRSNKHTAQCMNNDLVWSSSVDVQFTQFS